MPVSVTMHAAVLDRSRPCGAISVLGIGWLLPQLLGLTGVRQHRPRMCTGRRGGSYALGQSFTSRVAALHDAALEGRALAGKFGLCAAEALQQPRPRAVNRNPGEDRTRRRWRGVPFCVLPITAKRRREHGARRAMPPAPVEEALAPRCPGAANRLTSRAPADPGGNASPLVVLYASPM
jgi:hypothetical protein